MDELIKLVTEGAGISEDQARTAVETVIGYLKDNLPGPIASQIDSVLGGAGMVGDVGDVVKGLGGMLGKR